MVLKTSVHVPSLSLCTPACPVTRNTVTVSACDGYRTCSTASTKRRNAVTQQPGSVCVNDTRNLAQGLEGVKGDVGTTRNYGLQIHGRNSGFKESRNCRSEKVRRGVVVFAESASTLGAIADLEDTNLSSVATKPAPKKRRGKRTPPLDPLPVDGRPIEGSDSVAKNSNDVASLDRFDVGSDVSTSDSLKGLGSERLPRVQDFSAQSDPWSNDRGSEEDNFIASGGSMMNPQEGGSASDSRPRVPVGEAPAEMPAQRSQPDRKLQEVLARATKELENRSPANESFAGTDEGEGSAEGPFSGGAGSLRDAVGKMAEKAREEMKDDETTRTQTVRGEESRVQELTEEMNAFEADSKEEHKAKDVEGAEARLEGKLNDEEAHHMVQEGTEEAGEQVKDAFEGAEREEVDEDEDDDVEVEKGFKMSRVCDRLIEVFWIERTEPDDWRKLLAFSEEWINLRGHFFKRLQAKAAAMEDPQKRETLFRLGRRLKEVDEDMDRHNELVKAIETAEEATELDQLVLRRRKDFTGAFFDHLRLLCDAQYRSPERQEELAAMATRVLTAVNSHDVFVEDQVSLQGAEAKFADILNQPDLKSACNKIDELAGKGQLDSTLMLLITKAWAASKESSMMKEEVKDTMYYLYQQARGNLQRLVPPEVRIMRHLITLDDPREQYAMLTEAFCPGDELQGKDVDYLSTTPEKLLQWVKHVVDSFYTHTGSSLILEARRLMKPGIITKLEILKDLIEKEFM
eukprot:TRINITY_DN9769_c0_g1_i1.p1 TRINITY_DN9769_c0_g1~~TRINITY_DN9769_c0_g1_i1.p1  ORF type:complete len:743 (-),score=174.47 TRINITY_DN9769_c0_g1_i1:830-3058(-)